MYEIIQITPHTTSPKIINKILDFQEKAHNEYDPEEILPPRETRKKDLLNPSKTFFKIRYYAFHKEEIVGRGILSYELLEKNTNPEYCNMSVKVLPQHCKKLVGTKLLIYLLKEAKNLGKTRVISWIKEGEVNHYGHQWAKKLGLREVMAEYKNILYLREVNTNNIIEKLLLSKKIPESIEFEFLNKKDYLDLILKNQDFRRELADFMTEVTNLVPRGDTEEKDFIVTENDLLREAEEFIKDPWDFFSIYAKIGKRIIGKTEIYFIENNSPKIAYTGLTAVRKKYQGLGIATALKALMIKKLKSEKFERLETENATTNEPILKLNFKLGFKTKFKWIKYEGTIEQIEKTLKNTHPSLF